jgi:hypothetical protein
MWFYKFHDVLHVVSINIINGTLVFFYFKAFEKKKNCSGQTTPKGHGGGSATLKIGLSHPLGQNAGDQPPLQIYIFI